MRSQLILLFGVCMILSACQAKPSAELTGLNATNIYRGYPCFQECEAFESGFTQAENAELTEPHQCSDSLTAQKLGCLAYVQEYRSEHISEFKL